MSCGGRPKSLGAIVPAIHAAFEAAVAALTDDYLRAYGPMDLGSALDSNSLKRRIAVLHINQVWPGRRGASGESLKTSIAFSVELARYMGEVGRKRGWNEVAIAQLLEDAQSVMDSLGGMIRAEGCEVSWGSGEDAPTIELDTDANQRVLVARATLTGLFG